MPSIFELTAQQAELMKRVEDGEFTAEEAADTFEMMQGDLDEKINSYCVVRRDLTNQLDNIKAEIDRLTALRKTKENEINNLTNSLKSGLEGIKKSKFDTGLFKGHFRKGAVSLKIHKTELVPDEYVETKITEAVNKTELKKAIQSGEVKLTSDIAELVTGESTLIIK